MGFHESPYLFVSIKVGTESMCIYRSPRVFVVSAHDLAVGTHGLSLQSISAIPSHRPTTPTPQEASRPPRPRPEPRVPCPRPGAFERRRPLARADNAVVP